MITVTISINGSPIYTRTAVNVGKDPSGYHNYKLDDGSKLMHHRQEGAVALAVRMLGTIKEVKKDVGD